MGRRFAWFLNFDADDELARPDGYAPTRATSERLRSLPGKVGPLLGPGDVLLHEGDKVPSGAWQARAWMLTPRARRILSSAGAILPQHPPLDVLRRVNHREFAATLGGWHSLSGFVHDETELSLLLSERADDFPWVLKRPFGFAGRGKLLLRTRELGDERSRSWLAASFRDHGGVQAEPWVERLGDYGLHGFLDQAGNVTLGAPTEQRVSDTGTWLGSHVAACGALSPEEEQALRASAFASAEALRATGYFGPFGIDAFRWRDEAGHVRFNARCEINARYSMGWAIGMSDSRPDLEES